MLKRKIKIISVPAAIALLVAAVSSCEKAVTVVQDSSQEVTTTVSFSKDLQPLLTANCAKSGCHNGSITPDLSIGKAYNALSAGYLDKANPSNSLVYLWMTGKKSTTMPLGGQYNPSNINGLMLAWIKQGANNN